MDQSTVCHVCGGDLCELIGFPVAIQVSSDCRPWKGSGRLATCVRCQTVQKVVTKEWRQEMTNLYAGYAMYEQGGGNEQMSFDVGSGTGLARSQKIVEWLNTTGIVPQGGDLLDVGCGNGAFMRAFNTRCPEWQMTGLELDARNHASITAIPGVVDLHVGDLESLNGRFDLISLIHALEHIPDPCRYLREIGGRLKSGGMVLIEVPDVDKSRFDILIADHCSHFSATTLRNVVRMAGFEIVRIEAGCVAKELTLLARPVLHPVNPAETTSPSLDGEIAARGHLKWLEKVLAQGEAFGTAVGIFGTSISATWLAAALGDRVKFFVEEDANRIGRWHMELPIHGSHDAPRGRPILMPLQPEVATSIYNRLLDTHLEFVRPPAD